MAESDHPANSVNPAGRKVSPQAAAAMYEYLVILLAVTRGKKIGNELRTSPGCEALCGEPTCHIPHH